MLKNKTVIVTGASRGIGKATAIALAEMGANLVLNYRNGKDIKELIDEIEKIGAKVIAVQADVSNYEEAKRLITEAQEAFGTVDILVNNAGITKDNLLLRMKEAEFDDVINVNLKGSYNCLKHASQVMIKQKSGKIINLASVVGLVGNVGQINYAASKAGIIGMTKSAAKELANWGITVNAVAPGFIETDMTSALKDNIKEKVLEQIPLRKLGKPQDVANLICFLASDSADYITGQILNVDGGMVM